MLEWVSASVECVSGGNIINTSLFSLPSAGRVLVQEWAKYRWGVFEEYGHPGDSLYPTFHRTNTQAHNPTGCSNVAIHGSTWVYRVLGIIPAVVSLYTASQKCGTRMVCTRRCCENCWYSSSLMANWRGLLFHYSGHAKRDLMWHEVSSLSMFWDTGWTCRTNFVTSVNEVLWFQTFRTPVQ